jgi:pyruvate formate lyase activating enzyme
MLNVHSIETFGTHEGPGIRLVVFLQGCAMRCAYCHNPDSQPLQSSHAQQFSVEQILEKLEKEKPYFKDQGGLTVSGGEPTLQAKKLIPLFKAARAQGFHTALDTCGAILNDEVQQLYDLTDLVILDVKHIDDRQHQKLTGHSNHNALANALYREKSGKPMWLRYVLVPGWTDQPESLEKWAQHFADYKNIERVEILPYHTLGVYKYQQLGLPYQLNDVQPPTEDEIATARQIFAAHLNQVVVR